MFLDELITQGRAISSSGDEVLFKKWQANIRKKLLSNQEVSDKDKKIINAAIECSLNPLSGLENKSKIINTVTEAVEVLELLEVSLNKATDGRGKLTINVALEVIDRILLNFHKHLEVMYQSDTHGKAGITKDLLKDIQIKNEYDVQRILYSLIKQIFPLARVEKQGDGGYLGTRCDIVLDEYDICIEVKCTRDSMTERKLTEEIGSDITHYNSKYRFFFVYDKEKILKNKDSFESRYTYFEIDPYKDIRTFVIQPITL